jgi:hypothetical protein
VLAEGGYAYRHLRLVSGILHSNGSVSACISEAERPGGAAGMRLVLRTATPICDDWLVAGLKGSGSNTFSSNAVCAGSLPSPAGAGEGHPARRPDLPSRHAGFTANEHAAFVLIAPGAPCGHRTAVTGRGPTQTAWRTARSSSAPWASGPAPQGARLCVDVFERAWQVSEGRPDASH